MKSFQIQLPDESATKQVAGVLSQCCDEAVTIYFVGNLGAGKTTFIRGFLRGLNYEGKVKSPTYTLVEPYHINDRDVFHFDLYRLKDPNELEFIGIDDYFHSEAICLLEWPEKGEDKLPSPDLTCYIEPSQSGRLLRIESRSNKGNVVLTRLASKGL